MKILKLRFLVLLIKNLLHVYGSSKQDFYYISFI